MSSACFGGVTERSCSPARAVSPLLVSGATWNVSNWGCYGCVFQTALKFLRGPCKQLAAGRVRVRKESFLKCNGLGQFPAVLYVSALSYTGGHVSISYLHQ